jgi:hypothetical protein
MVHPQNQRKRTPSIQASPVSWLAVGEATHCRAGVRSELHVFDQGGHVFALSGTADKTGAAWPTLFLDWVAKLPSGALNKT